MPLAQTHGRTFGRLGDGTTTSRPSPVQIGTDTNWQAIATSAGAQATGSLPAHTMALRSDGTLWAWGYNGAGQLGDGTTQGRLSPVQIGTNTSWSAVAAGGQYTMALHNDGTLWAWGSKGIGQLGIGPWTQVLGGAVWGPPP